MNGQTRDVRSHHVPRLTRMKKCGLVRSLLANHKAAESRCGSCETIRGAIGFAVIFCIGPPLQHAVAWIVSQAYFPSGYVIMYTLATAREG